jgi:hypothetical protein
MPNYQCENCNKKFTKKCNFMAHKNRKNKCHLIIDTPEKTMILPEKTIIIPEKPIILQEIPIILIDNKKCKYCNKKFVRKDVADAHMKHHCPIVKQQNKAKQEIFDKLIILEEKNKRLEEEIKNKDNKEKLLEEEIKKLKDESNNVHTITLNNNSNNNIINDNSINNTINVINIVPHGNEDLINHKLDELLLILSTKKGYNAVLELIMRVHFSSRFPEFQNVYIPDIKNKHAMVYGTEWELKNIDDVISNLYDTKSDFITENKDIFYKHLNPGEKIVFERWAKCNNERDTEDFKNYIVDMYGQIKLLLFNKREITIATKKLQEMKK